VRLLDLETSVDIKRKVTGLKQNWRFST